MTRSTLRSLLLPLLFGAGVVSAGCGGHSPSDTGSSTAAPVSSASGGSSASTSPAVTLEATALPAAVAAQSTSPDPVLALAFKVAAAEDVTLTTIDVDAAGSIDESTLGDAALIHDLDASATVGATEPQLATAPAALQDDGSYRFQLGSPLALAAGDVVHLLVTVDASVLSPLDQAKAVGQTVALEVNAVTATDAQGSPSAVTGAPGPSGSTTLEVNEHVLISELCTGPGSGATSAEFVELFNPTGATVDISSYHITDFSNDPSAGEFYWKLPTGANFGGAASYDFLVRFPAGASLAPGEVVVVAVDGEGFKATHGVDADYCMRNPGATSAVQMLTWDGQAGAVNFTASPVAPYAGLTGPSGGTTGSGEPVFLFAWDGVSDLVQDIDLVNYGQSSYANTTVDKSPGQQATNPSAPDVVVDSIFDNDRQTSTYQPDTSDFDQFNLRAPLGASVKRVDFTEGQETKQAGNGIAGHDETSEDFGDGMGGNGTFVSIPLVADATPGSVD